MKKTIPLFLPLFLLAACSNNPTADTKQDTAKNDSATGHAEIVKESDNPLPSPMVVAAMFKQSGMKYLPGITNTPDKASNYASTFSRAENMGVYSADMAYCVTNKQSSDGKKYLKTIRDVGTQINLGKVFDNSSLFDRFNNNIDNEDSIGHIVADIQYATDMQLDQDQQQYIYGIIFAGAWTESMYIGTQVYQKDGNDKLVPSLMQQMSVLKNLIEDLQANKDKDANIPGLVTDLMQIQDAVNAMPSMKKLNTNPDLDITDIVPTKDELAPVIKKITDLRTKITNG